MSIKKKISDTVYEIYVGYPETVNVPVYRGDNFNFTLIGFNEADDSPFDFSLYDNITSQIRLGDPRNPETEKELTSSNFVLGKTDVTNQESDELHVIGQDIMDFDKPYRTLWMDIEGLLGDEKTTFIKLKLTVEPDVTKDNA